MSVRKCSDALRLSAGSHSKYGQIGTGTLRYRTVPQYGITGPHKHCCGAEKENISLGSGTALKVIFFIQVPSNGVISSPFSHSLNFFSKNHMGTTRY